MGLPLRVQAPDATFHVTFHSVHEQQFFLDDVDRRFHVSLCGLVAVRCHWRFLAWCQMGNHGHLVVRTPEPNLSRGMQMLTSRYVRAFNERHGRKGALVARRFFSTVIESEAHLLGVLRYVPLNPGRAGMCKRPEDWRWSSYRATVGVDPAPTFLAADEVLRLFGRDPDRARERYSTFVLDGLG